MRITKRMPNGDFFLMEGTKVITNATKEYHLDLGLVRPYDARTTTPSPPRIADAEVEFTGRRHRH